MDIPEYVRDSKPGFTTVELLVVMSVITILIGILLPVLSRARKSSVEMASIGEVKQMFDTLMHIHIEEHQALPRWWQDEHFVIHSELHTRPDERTPVELHPVHGFNLNVFEDPFRVSTTIGDDPLLTKLGRFVDSEHGMEGHGYFYVPFNSNVRIPNSNRPPSNSIYHPMWDLRPRHEDEEPAWTRLNLPGETEYLIWGVGKNGKLDGDPALDVVLIKLPHNETLIRHRPVQPQTAGPGKQNVDRNR
ncbi:MAG: type II secretion system protein [Planctomycetota bacterium]|nr:type II secretion system protein [Planctomycetota bacterium]